MADIKRLPGPWLQQFEWQLHAACRGMDSAIFFHPPAERNSQREDRIARAKAVCSGCPARYTRPPGPGHFTPWSPTESRGGLSEDERATLLGFPHCAGAVAGA